MLSSKTTRDGHALAHVDCTICSDDSNRLHSDVRAVLLTLLPDWAAHNIAIEQCKGGKTNKSNLLHRATARLILPSFHSKV